MTLHSRKLCNHHDADFGRDRDYPIPPLERYTPEESRAREDWWLAKMPGAGKSRSHKREYPRETQSFKQYRQAFIEALQDWVTRADLAELADGERGAVSGFLNARYKRDHIEQKRMDGQTYYRFNDAAKKFGFRYVDIQAEVLAVADDWMTAGDVAARLDVATDYIRMELSEMFANGLLTRRRKSDNWQYRGAA